MAQRVEDWPIYITDDGQVQCYENTGPCDDDVWTPCRAGRRTTVAGMVAEIRRHAAEDHGAEIKDANSATLTVPDGPKMLRETLCVAQWAIGLTDATAERKDEHRQRIQRLIDECDRHRPVGQDGKHGDRHTETCGCED